MDFNPEKSRKEINRYQTEDYEAKLRGMEDNVDLFQSLGYDKLYQAKFEMYEYIVDALRMVCSEIGTLKAKGEMDSRDKKLYQSLLEQYDSLSSQEFKLKVFFKNVKSYPENESETPEASE